MKRIVLVALAAFAFSFSTALAQLAVDGALSTEETTGAEAHVDDSGTENAIWGTNNDIHQIYVNYDQAGILFTVTGRLIGNGLILYLDNSTTTGLIADFSGNRGFVGPWPRNLVVNETYKPDFFAASWMANATDTTAMSLHAIDGTNVSNVATSATAVNARPDVTGDFITEIYIPYSAFFPGGGNNSVPPNAKARFAVFILGGDNYSGGDAAVGTGTDPATNNLPGSNGTDLPTAAQLNVWTEVTIDSTGDGVPDNYVGNLEFSPIGLEMVFQNDLAQLAFPEEVEQASAENAANYTVVEPAGVSITEITKGPNSNVNKVFLRLSRELAVRETLTIQSQGIKPASNPAKSSPLVSQSTIGHRRIVIKYDQSATGDAIFASDKIYFKGAWSSYNFYHALWDTGPVDTLPDVPGVQAVDEVAGDNILTGYTFFAEATPQDYGYAIVGQSDPGFGIGQQEYEAGYFQGNFDRIVKSTDPEIITLPDPYANGLLQIPVTVTFTMRFPKSYAGLADLTAPYGPVRLQGGGNGGGNHGVIPPMVSGAADQGKEMTFVGEDDNYTIWQTDITFTPGPNIFDVAEFRFVVGDLAGLEEWYEPDAFQNSDPNLAQNSIHPHAFRIYNASGNPNDQDITLTFLESNSRTTPTLDVPPRPNLTGSTGRWTLYE